MEKSSPQLMYKNAAIGSVNLKENTEEGTTGVFTGYASVFNNVDSYGDMVLPGAFSESLKTYRESGAGIPCYWSHRMDDPEMCIGETITAEEDDTGLRVTVRLDIDTNVKAARAYELIKSGRVSQMSFAYLIEEAGPTSTPESDNEIFELRKLKIFEVSLVQIGANTETEVTDVKHAATRFKAGRKVSAANHEKLVKARELINEVIESTDDSSSEESGQDATAQEQETATAQEHQPVKERMLDPDEIARLKKYFSHQKGHSSL